MRTKWLTSVALSALVVAQPAYAEEMPFVLNADEIDFATTEGIIRARGNVEVLSEKGALQANEIVYDTKTEKLVARGDVLLIDEKKAAVFSDEIEVEGAFRTATIEAIRLRMVEGPALTARHAKKNEDDTYALKHATYSACPVSGDEIAPWKIRANDIVYNNEKETVTYKNAWFDVYGIPLLWLPYVTHTTNFDEPRSGVLPPRFGSSSDKGQEMSLGYYVYAAPTYDFTLRARYMTKRGLQYGLENRFNTEKAVGDLRGTIIEDRKNDDDVRGNFNGYTEWTLDRGERIGFNAKLATDDTYIDDFLRDNPSYLPSSVYYENASQKHYFSVNSRYYQDLREGRLDGQTAQPLGNLQFERVFSTGHAGDSLIINTDVMSLHRSSGNRMQRMVAQAQYIRPYAFNTGDMVDLSASVRGDAYHLDPITNESSWETRALPELSVFWQRPMMSPNGYHTITPMVKGIIAPNGVNPSEIPNEDSVEYELDSANLFEENRFAGFDRIEGGTRVIYGVRNDWQTSEGFRLFSFFLGQSWRENDNANLPELGGAGTQFSDWVGFARANFTEKLHIASHFRLDNDSFVPRRADSSLRYGGRSEYDNSLRISHTYLDDGPEEARIQGRYNFSTTWFADVDARRDFNDGGRWLRATGTLGYRHCCYTLSLSLSRRGFDNRNVPPSTEFQFNVELMTLGRQVD